MNLASFISLIDPRTKISSILPFLFGSLYALYAFDTFSWSAAIILFLTIFIFNIAITLLHHYMNYKRALLQEYSDSEIHNSILYSNLNPKPSKLILFLMLFLSILLGLYLAYITNGFVLILVILCFVIGMIYTYGPLPIAHTPLGELMVGITLGLNITFMSIYIHVFNSNLLNFQFRLNQFFISINLYELIGIFIVCMPFVITIANIRLAHNLCEIEEDFTNKRYTLPIHIGQISALMLFEISYYMVYFFIVIAVLVHYLPWLCLISVITFIPVKHHIDYFKLKQVKSETLTYVTQNFLLISLSLILTLGLDLFIEYYIF
ncbi:MAG: 1,4-dihydroxy-2-naphthoate polyprenyltransferase [Cellulosilyticum sp.]|nr:1,4-dihydroxy-2-naphthoate polyprenyltransferase [Cellulosilyticum sp.]